MSILIAGDISKHDHVNFWFSHGFKNIAISVKMKFWCEISSLIMSVVTLETSEDKQASLTRRPTTLE